MDGQPGLILYYNLIPAESMADGGDEGRFLLIALALVHIATGVLALKRTSLVLLERPFPLGFDVRPFPLVIFD